MAQKICNICLKPYDYCHVCEDGFAKGLFAWRTVCCSYNCAIKYFEKIEEENKEVNNTSEK